MAKALWLCIVTGRMYAAGLGNMGHSQCGRVVGPAGKM